ncbi:MAG: polysaccharide pyruvyl transferase family protein [bacterium]
MKQVTIGGVSVTGNRGAEAMLITAIGRIRDKHPDTLFNIFTIYPEEDTKLINDYKIRIFNSKPFYLSCILFPLSITLSIAKFFKLKFLYGIFPRAVTSIADSSIFVDLSGVSFMDNRLKFLPYNILMILPALILGVPVIKGAQAMGPFNKSLNRLSAKLLLKKCNLVFARGKYTRQYLNGLNLINVINSTDIAFLHGSNDNLTEENNEYTKTILRKISEFKINGQLIVGICPSSVVYKKAGSKYIHLLVSIIENIIKSGHSVLLFPNATRQNNMSKLHNNDLPVILDLLDFFRSNGGNQLEHIIYIDRNINTGSIKKLINSIDIAVISRFHAMINCLSLGIPLLVIGWSEKYLEIMEYFSMEEWVFDYTTENQEEVVQRLALLMSQRKYISAHIKKRYPDVKKLAELQINYINAFLSQ